VHGDNIVAACPDPDGRYAYRDCPARPRDPVSPTSDRGRRRENAHAKP
jgi:hypothetical protein